MHESVEIMDDVVVSVEWDGSILWPSLGFILDLRHKSYRIGETRVFGGTTESIIREIDLIDETILHSGSEDRVLEEVGVNQWWECRKEDENRCNDAEIKSFHGVICEEIRSSYNRIGHSTFLR